MKKSTGKKSSEKPPINLNTCVPGQKLLTRQGTGAIYVCRISKNPLYNHKIKLDDNDFIESRTNDGYVFKNITVRDPKTDLDIVEILPIVPVEEAQ